MGGHVDLRRKRRDNEKQYDFTSANSFPSHPRGWGQRDSFDETIARPVDETRSFVIARVLAPTTVFVHAQRDVSTPLVMVAVVVVVAVVVFVD